MHLGRWTNVWMKIKPSYLKVKFTNVCFEWLNQASNGKRQVKNSNDLSHKNEVGESIDAVFCVLSNPLADRFEHLPNAHQTENFTKRSRHRGNFKWPLIENHAPSIDQWRQTSSLRHPRSCHTVSGRFWSVKIVKNSWTMLLPRKVPAVKQFQQGADLMPSIGNAIYDL